MIRKTKHMIILFVLVFRGLRYKNINFYYNVQLNKYVIIATSILLFLINSNALAFQYNESEYYKSLWTGNLNLFLGRKALEKDEWEPVEKQREYGIALDFRRNSWPLYSKDDGTFVDPLIGRFNVEGETHELNFGFRKILRLPKNIRPFLGGGISYIRAKTKGEAWGITVSDSEKNFGYWLGGGTYWILGRSFNLGVDIKYSYAELDIFDEAEEPEVNAGGIHLGILIGYHW